MQRTKRTAIDKFEIIPKLSIDKESFRLYFTNRLIKQQVK